MFFVMPQTVRRRRQRGGALGLLDVAFLGDGGRRPECDLGPAEVLARAVSAVVTWCSRRTRRGSSSGALLGHGRTSSGGLGAVLGADAARGRVAAQGLVAFLFGTEAAVLPSAGLSTEVTPQSACLKLSSQGLVAALISAEVAAPNLTASNGLPAPCREVVPVNCPFSLSQGAHGRESSRGS